MHPVVAEERYEVFGADFREAYASVASLGPVDSRGRRQHGLTRYELVPSWQFLESRRECRMLSVRVVARVTVLLPRWKDGERASADSRADWRRFMNELRDHEYQHRDNVLESAEALYSALRGLYARDCDALRQEAYSRTRGEYDSLQRRQAELDGETVDAR